MLLLTPCQNSDRPAKMAKRKIKTEKKIEIPHSFPVQELDYEDFYKIVRSVENSDCLFFQYEDNPVNVDSSQMIEKRKLLIKDKKGDVLKLISYKNIEKITVIGNSYDCLKLFCEKKSYYLPITKNNGDLVNLIGNR